MQERVGEQEEVSERQKRGTEGERDTEKGGYAG